MRRIDHCSKNSASKHGFTETFERLTFLSDTRLAFYGARFASARTFTAVVQMSPFVSESVLLFLVDSSSHSLTPSVSQSRDAVFHLHLLTCRWSSHCDTVSPF